MDDTNNPLVAPDRCIWLVTVDGPFQSVSSLTGAKEPVATSYTVLIDSASGDVLDLLAVRVRPVSPRERGWALRDLHREIPLRRLRR